MAAAKVAVTSRVTSLENELRAAHAAGAALRSQLEDREDLIMKLNERIRAMPHGGASPAAAAETGRGNAARESSSLAPGLTSDLSPAGTQRGTATAAFDFQRGNSPSPTSTSPPTSSSVPSWPADRHVQPGGSPRHSSQSLASEASPTGSGTRKSVQGLLARVHDMRQFVEGTSSPPATASAAAGRDSSSELAERLAGLSSALTDWNNNTSDDGSGFEFGFRS